MTNQIDPNQLEIWRLFLNTHAKIIRQIDKELADANQIPLNWYDVLIELYEAPEKKLRMSDIADRVLLTRSGLTRLVDKLEKTGYLIREIDPEDRRGFYAVITDDGVNAMREAWKVYSRTIEDFFGQHLNPDAMPMLKTMFSNMIEHIDNLD